MFFTPQTWDKEMCEIKKCMMCTVDGEGEYVIDCVLDKGNIDDCLIKDKPERKEDCEHWSSVEVET